MVTIVIAVMIIAAGAVVAWPLINGRDVRPAAANRVDPALENLLVQRDAAYSAIKDLEFDHAMGKLSDADYKAMRAKYESKAVGILQELDSLKSTLTRSRGGSEDAIERQVKQLRRGALARPSIQCPKCGTSHTGTDAFCSKCGTALRGTRCSECGTRASPGDRFCARCGSPIRTTG